MASPAEEPTQPTSNLLDPGATLPPSLDPDATLPPDTDSVQSHPGEAVVDGRAPQGYEIERELGRGGMGVVYLARHRKLNRTCALKMILAGAHADAADLERFRTEAQAIARLQHPGIVQVFEIGDHDGKPFMALEFCAGGGLDRKLAENPLPPRAAADLVRALAEAAHAAHQARVIHRDLKPANVLLTADGVPKITDFGLAKKLDEHGATRTGSVMGTPAYMPPEQAEGKKDIGPAADVYALGAILYECLTGRPPFKAATTLDTILQLLTQDPVPPRKLQPATPADLETICLKCLQKEPGRRYASAEALGADLQRFLAGEPILGRPVGGIERAAKWARRRPAVAALLGVVVLLTAAGLTGVGWGYAEALRERKAAEEERDNARQQERLAREAEERAGVSEARAVVTAEGNRRSLAHGRILLAQAAWDQGLTALARERLALVPPDLRSWDWYHLRQVYTGGMFTITRPGREITRIGFTPDGRNLLCNGSVPVFLDARTGEEVRVQPEGGDHTISPDGRLMASRGTGNGIPVREVQTGREVAVCRGHKATVFTVTFCPDGRRLASGGEDNTARVWDARTGRELLTLQGHTGQVGAVAFRPDGRYLATGSYDGTARLWDADTGRLLHLLGGFRGWVTRVEFSPDGRTLATTDLRTVKLWNVHTGQVTHDLGTRKANLTYMAFHPDGRYLAAGTNEGHVRSWDLVSGEELPALKGHVGHVGSLAFSPDGDRLMTSGGEDGTIKAWACRASPGVTVLQAGSLVYRVAFSPDGRRLATAGNDATARVIDVRTGQELQVLKGHKANLFDVVFSPDGQRLATASNDGLVKVWSAETGKEIVSLGTLFVGGGITCVAFTPDGLGIAAGDGGGNVKVGDAVSGRETLTFKADPESMTALAFSPDGKTLACRGKKGLVVCEAATGRELHRFAGDRSWVLGVVFEPEGLWLLTVPEVPGGPPGTRVEIVSLPAGRRGAPTGAGEVRLLSKDVALSPDRARLVRLTPEVKVFDSGSGEEHMTLPVDRAGVLSLAFSPDGHLLASGSRDGTVRLWQAGHAVETVALKGPTQGIWQVSFTPDSRRIVGQTIKEEKFVWDASTGQHLPDAADPLPPQALLRSPDGRSILSIGSIGTGRIQVAPVPDAEELARRRLLTRPRPEDHAAEAGRHPKANWSAETAFHLEQVLAVRDDPVVAQQLAQVLDRVTRRQTEPASVWRRLALARLQAGDRDGCRAACVEMQRRFDNSAVAGPAMLFLGSAPADALGRSLRVALFPSALLPGGPTTVDRGAVVRAGVLLPGALPGGVAWLEQVPEGDALLRGAILCRAGRHAEALKELTSVADPLALLFRAVSEHGQGNPATAATLLRQVPVPSLDPAEPSWLPWAERVELDALRREVEALLAGRVP